VQAKHEYSGRFPFELVRKKRDFRAISRFQFPHQIAHMNFNGALGNAQLEGD
jgi:hypothetical protein